MPSNGHFDPETKYVQLGERVENQATRIADLDMRMRQSFTDIASQIRGLSDDVRGGAKTQWPIIIGFCTVSITILGGLGYLALQPIKDNIAQIRDDAKVQGSSTATALATVVDKMVTNKELEWRTGRSAEDRARTDANVKELRDAQVPRAELDRVFAAYDQRFLDQQRQLTDMKEAQGNVYGTRDVILDLRERLDRMERQRTAQGG
ncbi:hypothetical protein [Rhizobium metallidurans]|uniref:Uncharacterized protein n=1 Tax=Rhizobium metallidurans TaxID=1265931 RepID=A0A7W6CRR7_9HYPH|nr:hypothetical protein [Rhizobium metallidurans]MBB3965968.1 hypothetical protein [Rhizobium metallidurans]